MSSELKTIQQDLPSIPKANIVTPMDLMASAVQHGMGADELEKLLSLQERYEANQAAKSFSAALARFQAACPTIHKNRQADRYTFASFDEIMKTIKPHLAEAGLSVRFSTKTEGPIITSYCTITHADGHSETTEFSAPIDPNMRVNETQKVGSANSYSKRYCLINALNLSVSDEIDDDGKGAGTPTLTDKQIVELKDYIQELKIDVPKFLEYLGADAVESIPAASWPKAMKAIERKAEKAK